MLDNAIIIFIFLTVVIYYIKPTILFRVEGGKYIFRDYGMGKRDGHKRTLFNMQTVVVLLAIFSYFISE